jgi:hypothetical protein
MLSVKVALAFSITLLIVAIGVVLSRSPLVVAGTNSVELATAVPLSKSASHSSCQAVGTVPQGTSAIRVSLSSGAGPTVRLKVLSSSHVVTEGELPAGWGLQANVSVPVKRLSHTVRNATICTSVGPSVERLFTFAPPIRPGNKENLGLNDVRLRMEYLRPGSHSWWSLASSVAYHMGLGHAASGTWLVFLVLALMLAVSVLAVRLTLRELG